jgi:hypothetical protein
MKHSVDTYNPNQEPQNMVCYLTLNVDKESNSTNYNYLVSHGTQVTINNIIQSIRKPNPTLHIVYLL